MSSTSHHGERGLCHGHPWAASHSFVDLRHDGYRPRSDGLNQVPRPHRSRRATALVELAPKRVRRSRGLGCFEAADLAVSKRIEDEGQELACDRDSCLVLAPALGDAR
jgi:hypothetical protein